MSENYILQLAMILGFLSVIFLTVWAKRRSYGLWGGSFATGYIVRVEEGFEQVPINAFLLTYYYPIISYQYTVGSETYMGSVGKELSRRFRVPEIDNFGRKMPQSRFFWRRLSVGGEIKIRVKNSDVSVSVPVFQASPQYISEQWTLLLIGIAFGCLCIGVVVNSLL